MLFAYISALTPPHSIQFYRQFDSKAHEKFSPGVLFWALPVFIVASLLPAGVLSCAQTGRKEILGEHLHMGSSWQLGLASGSGS